MKNKKLFNTLMVVSVIAIIAAGVLAVGNLQGWFGANSRGAIESADKFGSVNIERGGIAYTLKDGTVLKDGDIVETLAGSTVSLKLGDSTLRINESSEIVIKSSLDKIFKTEVSKGEVFADISKLKETESFEVSFAGKTAKALGTVFSVSVQEGSQIVNVFEGSVEVNDPTEELKETVAAGQSVTLLDVDGKTNKPSISVTNLDANSLNEFAIDEAKRIGLNRELCFNNPSLQKVLNDREAEREKAEQERLAYEQGLLDQGGNVAVVVTGKKTSQIPINANGKDVYTCTIQIKCSSILNHMDWLKPGKEKYVPKSGVILGSSPVQFVEGETAFDVLKRVCNAANIQLEYSYTPIYGSYYIEGINHLYEFDCGEPGNNLSGWMYKVNGWFPNYGCSSYKLKAGDVISWLYTCEGLGSDVGAPAFE